MQKESQCNSEEINWAGIICGSFKITKQTAQSSQPLSEEEFVKECLIAMAEEISPDLINSFRALSLSRRIVTERISEILEGQLKTKIETLVYYSLALYEYSDTKEIAQLILFL